MDDEWPDDRDERYAERIFGRYLHAIASEQQSFWHNFAPSGCFPHLRQISSSARRDIFAEPHTARPRTRQGSSQARGTHLS